MKKTLLIIGLIATTSLFAQTNLLLDGTADEWTYDTGENADAFDMTPNSTIKNNSGVEIDSPYRYEETTNPNGWYNSALDSWINENYGSNEQPGSSSDGNYDYVNDTKTRGLKISNTSRRLYQLVHVTAGVQYTFSIDTRAEVENVHSEVFMLNTQIENEDGLDEGIANENVDAYVKILDDYNPNKPSEEEKTFTTTTSTFTASSDIVVFYVRSLQSISSDYDVFYDNMMLYETATASVEEFSNYFNMYPNPVNDVLTIQSKNIEVSKVEIYNTIGQRVLEQDGLVKNTINVSSLPKGIYVLKLNSDSKSYSTKIVVE